jgi:hypothetical protein
MVASIQTHGRATCVTNLQFRSRRITVRHLGEVSFITGRERSVVDL